MFRSQQQMFIPWKKQHRTTTFLGRLLVGLMIVALLYNVGETYFFSKDAATISVKEAPQQQQQPKDDPLLAQQAQFWRVLYGIILDHDPECEKLPERIVPQQLDIGFDSSHDHPRPDIVWMDKPDVKRLKDAHRSFVADVQSSKTLKLAYKPGTRGVVMTASVSQLPVLVISLRMLRRTGSTLPLEVVLGSSSDYDQEICDTILPKLQAKCIILADIFHLAETGVALTKYQYKIVSVLFSSFEDVLLLDSDAFPLHDPALLFDTEPFNSTGLVLWPDFWYTSESPYFFEIAGLGPPPPLRDRASVESGEILYSKTKHEKSLLLATYYNYYGPKYYYSLQSQGAPGEGDKETFGWAAVAMNETVYFVHEPVTAIGHKDSKGEFFGSAMVQHDPAQDFERREAILSPGTKTTPPKTTTPQTSAKPDTVSYSNQQQQGTKKDNHVRPFFVHANFPKFDPATIFNHVPGPTRDSNLTRVRAWMNETHAIEKFGFDVERAFWEEILVTACEYESAFIAWRSTSGICGAAKKHWDDIFAATTLHATGHENNVAR